MDKTDRKSVDSQVVYLGISGVLHPSAMLYELLNERTLEDDGHRKYEAVGALDAALSGWPNACIIITSTQPWAKGLPAVLSELGPLAPRVLGHTFDDLTTKVPFGRRQRPISPEDYWRLSKSSVVLRHVEWLKPTHWIAVDDDGDRWPDDVALQNLVLTEGDKGLLAPESFDRLLTVLNGNFGAPVVSAGIPQTDGAHRERAEQLRKLENVAVRRTPMGIGYVLFSDLDASAREQCETFAAKRRGLLRLPSGEDAVFFGDYKLWIASLGGACPED